MTRTIEAVFEDGVLKPVNQLDLPEHQKVHVLIEVDSLVAGEGHAWHWQESRSINDGFDGSVADEVLRQRREH